MRLGTGPVRRPNCLFDFHRSEVGGRFAVVRPPPYREIDFDCACVCVACVRAKLCARGDFAVARGGQVEEHGRLTVPPSLRALGSQTNDLLHICYISGFICLFACATKGPEQMSF